MSHFCRIWWTILIRRPKCIGKLQTWTKIVGTIFIFFCHFWVPSYTVKLGKHSGYTRPTLFVEGREGLGLCELENALEMQKCPKTFFRDCSFELSFWVFFTSTSKAENNYSEYILTVFAFGIKNSPGSSTSAVDVVKLLRKRHLSSNKKELKNEKKNNNLPSHDWTGKGGGVVNSGWHQLRTNIDLHFKGHVWYWARARSNWMMGLIYGKCTIEQSVSTPI